MMVSYNKLLKLLIDRNLKKTDLKKLAGISSNAIAKIAKNQAISMGTAAKICKALNCNIGDIMEFDFNIGDNDG